jgi:heterotetrameric sarcosine oxidase gamma subunit
VPDWSPVARPVVGEEVRLAELTVSDLSLEPKWRVFGGYEDVKPGTAHGDGETLVWSVSPGEWTVVGPRPDQDPVVDLTHVRAMFRLTGAEAAAAALSHICALDLGDHMFPNHAAARTLVADIATELIRDDLGGTPSYLILPSRSFGQFAFLSVKRAAEGPVS